MLRSTVSGGWSPKLDYPGVFVGSGSTNQPARLAREVQRVVQNTAVAECAPPLYRNYFGVGLDAVSTAFD